jgi:hypothetical protein
VQQTSRSATPEEMLQTATFWVLYLMFVLVSASGLMATAQIALVARDFGLANQTLIPAARFVDSNVIWCGSERYDSPSLLG